MTQRKPDRAERVVEDLEFIRDCEGKPTPVCESADVVQLLRQEHEWMRRMVQREYIKLVQRAKTGDELNGYSLLKIILEQLTQRRK